MLKVFVCGGSGYAGCELLRILSTHPEVIVAGVSSEKSAGKYVTDLFPGLYKYRSLAYEHLQKEEILKKADLFFLALPHAESQDAVDFFYRQGKKVIDLSADYRLRDAEVYEDWYRVPHRFRKTLGKAVYGLPEVYRKKIRTSRLIANPGCYPTGAILGLLPALKKKVIDVSPIIIDSKSGTSGAGRKADVALSFCEVNEGFKAYAIGSHRHTPEIEQELSAACGIPVTVNFTPHLLPVDRGILTTIYAPAVKKYTTEGIIKVYEEFYGKEPFVRVLESGRYPNIKNVRGTNYCEIGIRMNERTNTLIIVTAIDNLVKGASGQAVHNMNIMMGFEEKTGLDAMPLIP
ncbi:MAG TPA: N-acetyl-gamma-glutamyl-phosphate reductase [Thermodesulfovibrionales bacterium]|nr:N-acetyl-gamma-glutamyl-phosphate reductase [Thermodesulfovibrionales bacterium]